MEFLSNVLRVELVFSLDVGYTTQEKWFLEVLIHFTLLLFCVCVEY